MDTLNILLLTAGVAIATALVFLSGYETGRKNGVTSERALADMRIAGLLASHNKSVGKRRATKRRAAK
jgi:hypothetical protein